MSLGSQEVGVLEKIPFCVSVFTSLRARAAGLISVPSAKITASSASLRQQVDAANRVSRGLPGVVPLHKSA